jgi:hypothetical protein
LDGLDSLSLPPVQGPVSSIPQNGEKQQLTKPYHFAGIGTVIKALFKPWATVKDTDTTNAKIGGLHDTGGYPGLSATTEESLVAATITQSVDRLNKVSPETDKKPRTPKTFRA